MIRCPFKADLGFKISWHGPPSLQIYTQGEAVNTNVLQSDRLSVVGQFKEGEYNIRISNIQRSDQGKYQCFGSVNGSIVTVLVELNFAGKYATLMIFI